jgi:hypothetical protein
MSGISLVQDSEASNLPFVSIFNPKPNWRKATAGEIGVMLGCAFSRHTARVSSPHHLHLISLDEVCCARD